MDVILNFFVDKFSNLAWLAVFLVAMLPIAEAKVAIPFGISKTIWKGAALSPLAAGAIAFVGSTLPAFFIIPFLKPFFNKLKKHKKFEKIVEFFENIFMRKASNKDHKIQMQMHKRNLGTAVLNEQSNRFIYLSTTGGRVPAVKGRKPFKMLREFVTLVFFVALPLPLAGVWMSSAIGAFSSMKFWPSFFAIFIGNLFEVIFVTLLCTIFINSIGVVLIATVILISIYVVIMLLISRAQKKKTAA